MAASTGSSSMILAERAPPMCMPRGPRAGALAWIVPMSSPWGASTWRTLSLPPRGVRRARREAREGVRVRGDEAGEHAHGGAGVAAVEWGGGLDEGACGAGDRDGLVGIMHDRRAEGLHAGEGGVGVGAGGEVGESRGAFGDSGEHGVTVGDGL